MLTYHLLKEYTASLNIELLGIIDGGDLEDTREMLLERISNHHDTPWENSHVISRTSPHYHLPGCKSILLLALPYQKPLIPETPQQDMGPRGSVARFAQSIDYHHLLKYKAQQIVDFLKKETNVSFSFQILVDKTSLVERALVKKAGVTTGLNCTIFSENYGSWIALGEILLDLTLPISSATASSTCLECEECLKVCPTGAIAAKRPMDPFKCISYLTQSPGNMPEAYRTLLGNQIYGCDACQEVCPLNQVASPSPLPELGHLFLPSKPALIPFLNMTKKEFSLTAGLTCAGWRGHLPLMRNAVINLGNSGDDRAEAPLASLLYSHQRPEIRGHAAWALGQLGNNRARTALDRVLFREKDPQVLQEVRNSLALL